LLSRGESRPARLPEPARRAGADPRHEHRQPLPPRRRLPRARLRLGRHGGPRATGRRGSPDHSAVRAPHGVGAGASGGVTTTVAPPPGVGSASAVPPWAWVTAATMERPRPTPPLARARDVSAR